MPAALSAAALLQLRLLCGGAVHLPGDAGYAAAWDLLRAAGPADSSAPVGPAAVLYPGDEAEVVESLLQARTFGLRVLVQRTGIGPRAAGPLSRVVVLRTSGLGGVRYERGRLIARAGALCADVAALAATADGLARTLPTGEPTSGVVGGTVLGGPAVSATIAAARAVLADGSLLTALPSDDLVRALRAGILPAAVVTELTLAAGPVDAGPPGDVSPGVLPADAALDGFVSIGHAAIREAIDPDGLFLVPS